MSKAEFHRHRTFALPYNFWVADHSSRIVHQPRVAHGQPLSGLRTPHKMAAKVLNTAWTSIAGKRLPLLCLSSPEKSPSTKAAPAVIGFTSRWINPNKRPTIIAAYESEVPKNENVAGNCRARVVCRRPRKIISS